MAEQATTAYLSQKLKAHLSVQPMHTEQTKFCPRENRLSNYPMIKPGGRAATSWPNSSYQAS